MEKKKITKKEVMDAVKKHQHFLNKDCDDWVLMRADFSNCLIEVFSFGVKIGASNMLETINDTAALFNGDSVLNVVFDENTESVS